MVKTKKEKKIKNTEVKKAEEALTSQPTTPNVAPFDITPFKNAGGNISTYPIVFTKDSKYFFNSVGSTINVYSVATGAVVKVLSQSVDKGSHKDTITRVLLNPKNSLQLYSASLDGTIKLWDYSDDILLKTYNVKAPIELMEISDSTPEYAYIAVKDQSRKDIQSIVYRYHLASKVNDSKLRQIATSQKCLSMDVSQDGQYVAVADKYSVYVWAVDEEEEDVDESQLVIHKMTEKVTSVKFHPFKPMLAVGDCDGQIYCIDNYKSTENIRSLFHWHHLPVSCLHFMVDGSYLLSGGEEAVLVIWQLETGHKQFIPRLGGPISSIAISPSQRFYCIGLDDNSIRLINTITNNIEQVIQGVQYAKLNHKNNPLSTGIIVEPRNQHVVLNGVQGSIQFYDPIADRHIMDVGVIPMNRISRGGDKEIIYANISHVAFLPSGEWMATVDTRDDKITTFELFLKFWKWDPDTQAYQLLTRVDNPHSKPITSVTFNPVSRYGPMAVTTSEDKTFKVWSLNNAWTCRSVGVYRDCIPRTAAFSEDGSILAVAFDQIITIWDPYSNSIQTILTQPEPVMIDRLQFMGEGSPYLIAASKTHFYVWNMLTCLVWWSYKISVDHFAVDPVSNHFVVILNSPNKCSSLAIVFNPKSSVPVAIQQLRHGCLSVAWIPKELNTDHQSPISSSILIFNQNFEFNIYQLKSLQRPQQSIKNVETHSTLLEKDNQPNLLDGIYGKRTNERETDEQAHIRLRTVEAMRQEAISTLKKEGKSKQKEDGSVLSAPSHVLPDVESAFETFMESLMQLRIQGRESAPMAMDVDVKVEDNKVYLEDSSIEVNITQQPQEDFPSLCNYFSKALDKKVVPATSTKQADSSSDEQDDSDEDDAAAIEW
ncbi:WD40-repeat-containing domain protein [Pilobolus umbonatus]|nr:WD40-repeat-containing domain protein [Pilobolus umbonatus]